MDFDKAAAYKAELDKHPFDHMEQGLGNVQAMAGDASYHHRIRSLPCHMLHLERLDKSLDWHSHSRLHLDAYGGASDARRWHDAHDVHRNKPVLDTLDNTAEPPGKGTASCDGDNTAVTDNKDLIPVK